MENNRIIIFAFVLMSLFGFSLKAQTPLDSASMLYEQGRYAEAAAEYEKVVRENGTSASLLANLGNAYAKLGDYGKAMVCYERSLRLNPSDSKVRNNRAYIVSKVEDGNKANAKGKNISVMPDEQGFFSNLKTYITHSHTSNTWAVWGAICFVLLICCLALYIFREEVLIRKIGFFGSMISLGLCIVFVAFSFASAKACSTHNDGVVTGFKVSLLAEPFTTSKTTGIPLERGTKVDILEREKGEEGKTEWYKVRLNSEIAGWLQASDLEEI